MMSYFFGIWGFVRNKSVMGLRSADLPTRGVTPTKGAMLTKAAICRNSSTCRSSCTLDDRDAPFLDYELPTSLPTEKKSCSDLAETLHADLL